MQLSILLNAHLNEIKSKILKFLLFVYKILFNPIIIFNERTHLKKLL